MSELTYERAKQLYTPYDEGQMRHLCALRDVEIDRLRDENAKLRELVVRMFHTIEWSDRMSDSMYWPSFSYEQELRELGVEVDG